jgi:glycosyltransferase involved in cell wall biosynthesis
MNILFIHQNFPGQFKHLAPALAKLGHSVVAIGTNKPQYATPGVKVILHQPPIEKDAHKSLLPEISEMKLKMIRGRSVAKVLTLLKTNGFVPDVIYGHSGWGEILFVREVFPDVPLIVYAEYYYGTPGSDLNFDPEFSKYSIESIERIKIKNLHLVNGVLDADLAISPTHFQKDRHPEALQSKITVIHDGIESARFTPNEDASITLKNANRTFKPGDEIFTFVARELEPYRGYHILVRALPQILALRPEAHVVIVGGNGVSYGAPAPAGTTWKDYFLKEVKDHIDMSRVHFVGRVPHNVLTQLMQVSALHVYLTYPFVLSWSLMEAMSVGCLIVGSRTGPVQELIDDQKHGLLVDFFDPNGLASKIADVLAYRNDYIQLRNAARTRIAEQYDLYRHCLPEQIKLLTSIARLNTQ